MQENSKPTTPPVPAAANKESTPEEQAKIDAYAQSLLRTVNTEYEAAQAGKPKTKHFISKKVLISLIVGLVLTVALSVGLSALNKSKSKQQQNQQDQQDQQLINDVENFNNPNSY